jgi:hypothetical protein
VEKAGGLDVEMQDIKLKLTIFLPISSRTGLISTSTYSYGLGTAQCIRRHEELLGHWFSVNGGQIRRKPLYLEVVSLLPQSIG